MNAFLRSKIDFYFVKRINFFHIEKDTRNLFRLKKELNYTTIKDIRDLLKLKKETKSIKNRIIRDIKNLFKHEEEENYYKPLGLSFS